MKVAFLDCWSGVSGDMLLGALLDLGWPLARLRAGLARLPVAPDALVSEPARRGSLAGTRFVFTPMPVAAQRPSPGRGVVLPAGTPALAHTATRGLAEIEALVRDAALPPPVAARALQAFRLLAEVESRAHGIPAAAVHFHEVGALDTLVDICGVLLGMHELEVEEVYCSAVAVGSGTVQCAHGVLPVPAPGTLGLLAGVPILSGGLDGERATPTGAALLRVLVTEFEPVALRWRPERSGLGAGQRDDPRVPNLLRMTLGTRAPAPVGEPVLELTCQVDQVSGEELGFAMERLFAAGALDVVFTAVQMKKNRPGTLVTVLAPLHARAGLEGVLFQETGTLGVRCAELVRTVLPRHEATLATEFGPVRCKVRTMPDGRELPVPEFEELRRIALDRGLPLPEVATRVRRSLGSP
jgi:uncharacterized protein (TIGR00299 family) protein